MNTHEIIYIALSPPNIADAILIEKAASILNKDLYSTRLLLSAKVPGIIAQYPGIRDAASAAHSLECLGLRVLVFKNTDLHKHLPAFKARSLHFGQTEITFQDKIGHSKCVEAKQVFLIIQGTMKQHQETQVNKSTRKLNLAATFLSGGIPVRRTVNIRGTETSIHTENFLRIYEKPESDLCVEINSQDFNYSGLGANMTSASVANFTILIKKIKEYFPQAIFDDRLKEFSAVYIPSNTIEGKIDISCELIYQFHHAFLNPNLSS